MTSNALCYIDTETTGLDPDSHQAYEVSWWREDGAQQRAILPHSLTLADEKALEIGRYHERGIEPGAWPSRWQIVSHLAEQLQGVTLVGSNPGFDAAFLSRLIGSAPWSHRMIDVSQGAMWVLGWDRPRGLAAAADALRDLGFAIPAADHTAEGDVAATKAVHEALRKLQASTAFVPVVTL